MVKDWENASLNHMVLSTSYQCLPGNNMTLKTSVLGLALSPKPVSQAKSLPTSKLGTMGVTPSDSKVSDSSNEGSKQK
jgi:hypothetical protein